MKGSAQPDFSFSGLKTAVRQAATAIAPLSDQDVADICASFQAAVADALADRVGAQPGAVPQRVSRHRRRRRWSWPAASPPTARSGRRWRRNARERGFRFVAPPHELCTDNAAMIAWAGIERHARRARAADERLRLRAALALAARRAFPRRSSAPAGGEPRHEQRRASPCSAAAPGAPRWPCRCAAPATTSGSGRAMPRPSRRSSAGENPRYLPGITLDAGIAATTDIAEALDGADCVLAVTPAQALRDVLRSRRPRCAGRRAAGALRQGHRARDRRCCCRRSPSEFLPGQSGRRAVRPEFRHRRRQRPADRRGGRRAATRRWRQRLPQSLLDRTLPLLFDRRPRRRRDRRRAEERLCHRRRRGHRRRARRQRAGRHGDARLRRTAPHRRRPSAREPETLMGLSGLGDLLLTCASAQSRNFAYGLALGRGESLAGRPLAEGVRDGGDRRPHRPRARHRRADHLRRRRDPGRHDHHQRGGVGADVAAAAHRSRMIFRTRS